MGGRNLDESEFRQRLKRFVLTESQLRTNGFPRPDPSDEKLVKFYKYDSETAHEQNATSAGFPPDERLCFRCSQRIKVNPYTTQQCRFHLDRAFHQRGLGTRHGCCMGAVNSPPCRTHTHHVHRGNLRDVTGYCITQPRAMEEPGVYAMDCEMVYTDQGFEVAQVTIVNSRRQTAYQTLIKPAGQIIDYNTKFSGIAQADMAGIQTTLADVHEKLKSMFSDETILMGHSLECDMKTLKLLHSNIVDTSVVFPHRRGPPFKRALRHLAEEHLSRNIQRSHGVVGHDSREDAIAVIDLMMQKV